MNPTLSRWSASRRLATRLVLLAAASALTVLGLTLPAAADTGAASGGWIRLAHLSPDTPSVDVALTSFGNSKTMIKLSDVSYGDVSSYRKVPAGRYVASMTPAGGSSTSTPAVSQAVTVQDGHAYTVAAVGRNADLRGTVLDDDLRTPKAGAAKVRLLQAAVSASSTTVTAVGGPVLARDAAFGSATGYASIEAGVWTVEVAPKDGEPVQTKVTAPSGSVSTIIVLDGARGLTTKVITDAAAAPVRPKKGTGVQTGGGGTATTFVDAPTVEPATPSQSRTVGVGAVLLLLVGAGVTRRLRHRAAAVVVRTRG